MKATTTLMDIIQSELINNGFNEFSQKNELTFYNKDYAFIHKAMKYDEDVEKIVNDTFFGGIGLINESSDRRFKKQFVNRFLNRQIAYQTIEGFQSQVVYTLLTYYDYINTLYDNLDDYINNNQKSNTNDGGTTLHDNRFLESDLPQSVININVDDTTLDYGNRNTISRSRDEKTGTSETTSKNYSIDNLIKSNNLIHEMFIEFDKRCFMQIW